MATRWFVFEWEPVSRNNRAFDDRRGWMYDACLVDAPNRRTALDMAVASGLDPKKQLVARPAKAKDRENHSDLLMSYFIGPDTSRDQPYPEWRAERVAERVAEWDRMKGAWS
jgi:hypothetical protein